MAQSYLEKVLRHAGKKLSAEAQQKPTDVLELYRHFLKVEEHRLQLAHRSGEGGREICRRRAQLITVVLRDVWQRACQHLERTEGHANPEMFLAAVGGFGRGEMNPGSDVDILFIYTKDRRTPHPIVEKLVEQVLYMLWDVGFKVGHAARTLPELIAEANANLETKTSLLECNFLCGDEALWAQFEKTFWRQCIKGQEKPYLAWRVREQADRHQKQGGTVFVQEPHVKNGSGGLRDYQNLLWVAQVRKGIRSTQGLQEAKLLEAGERKQLEAAYDFILRLRTEMHLLCKRGEDRLNLELQGRVATSLRYSGNILRRTEALMRDYYQHARYLAQIGDTLAQRIAGEKPKARWNFLRGRGSRRYDHFVLKNGELDIDDPDLLRTDPRRLVRAFQLMQQYEAEISPRLAMRIRRRLRYLDRTFIGRREVSEMILALFRSKGKVARIFRRMHEMEILGKLFPEFARLTCLVQHEFFHRYTADEHTLVCMEMLDRILDSQDAPFKHYQPLLRKVEKPHLLYLAMLLHDTGKANNGADHSEASAANAVKVARRLRLSAEETSTLVFLVREHLTMSETARRKNLDDTDAVLEFARLVQTQERLDLLMLLTFADNEGTGISRQWSDWKELLLWQLYRRAEQALSGTTEFQDAARKSLDELREKIAARLGSSFDFSELHAHFETLPPRYFRTTSEEGIVDHLQLIHEFLSRQLEPGDGLKPAISWKNFKEEGYSEVTLVSWDRERVFSKITSAFAALGFSILSADIFTRTDNLIIDIFRFSTDRFEAATDERDRKKFIEIVESSLARDGFTVHDLIERNRKEHRFRYGFDRSSFPTRITFDHKSSAHHTLLDLQTPDRPGLLYDVAECLADFGAQIAHARIATEKGAALDTFYLTDREGQKWPATADLNGLSACIRGKLLGDPAATKTEVP